jgi:hypothetical protein
VWFAVFLGIGLLVAALNSHHYIEQVIYYDHYVPMAQQFAGTGHRDIMTYPIWGYSLLMNALPSDSLLVPVQVLLSAAAMFALFSAMYREKIVRRHLLILLFAAAWPWYALHSVKWPVSISVSLTTLSLVFLFRSIKQGRIWMAVAGGILAGVALNFRSHFLLLGATLIGIAAISWVVRRREGIPLVAPTIYAVCAILCLVPWGFHYRAETGHFSLNSSEGGMVAYITLGQLPGNPWNIVHDDSSAMEAVRQVDPGLKSYSDAGHRILIRKFVSNVTDHPWAFAEKIVHNFANLFFGGFYNWDPPHRSEQQDRNLEIMKEKLKHRFGFNPNVREIAEYRQSGEWDSFSVDAGTVLTVALLLLATALGSLYLIISLLGFVISIPRIIISPLYFILGSFVIYVVATVSFIQYTPRHINPLYLFAIPFFLSGARMLARWWSRLRRIHRHPA